MQFIEEVFCTHALVLFVVQDLVKHFAFNHLQKSEALAVHEVGGVREKLFALIDWVYSFFRLVCVLHLNLVFDHSFALVCLEELLDLLSPFHFVKDIDCRLFFT